MDLTRLYKNILIAIIPLSLASAAIEPKRLPLGILFGGALGIINLRGLAKGVKGLMELHAGGGGASPAGRMIFMSFFRLILLAAVIALLAASKLINLIGLLIGFTVVFALLLIEGLRVSKDNPDKEEVV